MDLEAKAIFEIYTEIIMKIFEKKPQIVAKLSIIFTGVATNLWVLNFHHLLRFVLKIILKLTQFIKSVRRGRECHNNRRTSKI